jgi:predicted metallo-beta-lactamase superfamily hydrolase
MFHGIEFARVGWVFATIIEHRGKKFMHTSDICGPMIEDYAAFIIRENPDILVLDGPPTYMYGYMLATVNLKRTIDNGMHILRNIDANPIIYDHHLTRDPYYVKRTKPVWDAAKEFEKPLVTAAEYLGQSPVILNRR